MKDIKIISFGEILWDVFPDHKALGGAPLNVAMRLASLGTNTSIISKLGTDPLAQETRSQIENSTLQTNYIQEDDQLETGQVTVTLDITGSASYTINKPVAWDAIELTQMNQNAVATADFLIFGSLSTRSEQSRNTLKELLPQAHYAIFDVNLRAPHYTLERVFYFMEKAQFIKMNDEELEEIKKYLQIKEETSKGQLQKLAQLTGAEIICITCGKEGAKLFKDNTLYEHKGYNVIVKDTVGAGDSFLAGLIYQLFAKESSADYALAYACAIGGLVASKSGAICEIHNSEIEELIG